jgi:HK97 gp10 family phage protein
MTVKVTGLPEIDKRFAALTGPKQRAEHRKAVRAAGSVLIKATKPRIPDRKRREGGKLTGLKRSMFQVPSSKWKNAGQMRQQGNIGTRIGFRKRSGAHAHLVEFGHRIVPRGGKGKPSRSKVSGRFSRRKFVPPYPFMRPAMSASQGQMREAARQKIIAGIKKNTR